MRAKADRTKGANLGAYYSQRGRAWQVSGDEGTIVKRAPIRPVSAKRARENRIRARLRAGLGVVACEARIEGVCTGTATDWHERRSRARGGSIIDPENRIMLCRLCHDWITAHPCMAKDWGWLE